MKKIVVFGATGGIGAYTVMDLGDYEVIAVGRRLSDNGFFKDFDVEYISVDITNKQDFNKLPRDVYAVINLAGVLPARMQGYYPQEYINTIININVLDYAKNAEKYIFAHSVSDVVHLFGKGLIPSDKTDKFPLNNDHSIYSICKNTHVNLTKHYQVKYGLKRFILRMPNVYLYHPDPNYYLDGVVKKQNYRLMIERAIYGLNIEIWGNPKIERDIVYVKDITGLIRNCIETAHNGGIFNAATGVGTSMKDQVKGIAEVFGGSYSYKPDMDDSPEYIFDISRTKELGYVPKYDYISYLNDFKDEMNKQTFEKLWGRE